MKISLEQLQVLDAIERHGSFTAAAAALHRVPSALSHAVAKLEADLGTPLFTRAGRRALLNEAGHTLLEDGRHLLRAARELERRIQRIATGWEAELRIGLDAIIPAERLLPLIRSFYEAGHQTQIRLSNEVLGGTWDALAADRADLVIGAPGDPPARGGISSRLLCPIRMRLVAAASHPLAAWPGPVPAGELVRHRAIVIADTSQELSARTIGLIDGQDTLRVPDMRSKAAAQLAGLGIGRLPGWLADAEIAAGRLVELQTLEPEPMVRSHIAWRNRQIGKALQWFLDELAKKHVVEALTVGLRDPAAG